MSPRHAPKLLSIKPSMGDSVIRNLNALRGLGMTKEQGEAVSLVFVIDDASVRRALTSLLQSVALRLEAFGSAADFLKKERIANGITARLPHFDIRLPGVSGLDQLVFHLPFLPVQRLRKA